MRDEEYFAIKDRAAARLLRIPHVTGVGVGGRERNGIPTGEIVIKVFVERKKPLVDVPPEERIPPSFEGVPTDVVEMGPPVPAEEPLGVVNPHLMSSDDSRTDPLRGGMYLEVNYEVLNDAATGTLGCIVRDKHDGTAVYGLTNGHVVTPDRGKLSRSRPVLQQDATNANTFTKFGRVTAGADDKRRDAAVVRLDPFQQWLPAILEIGFVTGTHKVTVEEARTGTYRVRKRGMKTKLTHGVVTAVGVDTSGDGKVGRIVIKPLMGAPLPPDKPVFFAYLGDSGSVIVNEQNEIVALLDGIDPVDPADPSVTTPFCAAYATPITTVLELFRKTERLDLEVAVAGANPTEATELQRVDLPAGAPIMDGQEVQRRGDPSYRRPLLGGLQLLAAPMLGIPNSTTLGCVVSDQSSPGGAFVLTSFAGVSANGSLPPTTATDVGQPDNDSSSTGCCSNTVGRFAEGGPNDSAPTAALVRLGEGHQWLAEALEIGTLEDVHTIIGPDLLGNFQVRKYGAGSRLTGGRVIAVGGVAGDLPAGVRDDAILIQPNPNPRKPNDAICFSHLIDRGAVIVDDDNRVVGLLYDEVDIPEANGRHVIHGVATPIQVVLDQLNALAGIDVKVATATRIDEVNTVTRRTMTGDAKTASNTPVRQPAPPAPARLEWLREELLQTPRGRHVIALWRAHHYEVRELIARNRKVATVWHRSGGPALIQAFARANELRTLRMPTELNGVATATCLDRIAAVFSKYGSEALRTDLARVRSVMPPLAGLSLTGLFDALNGAIVSHSG